MHARLLLPAVLMTACLRLTAHTGGEVQVTCPLDGCVFTAWQDFSGTAFGAQLDLKRLGPIAQPWTLPQCPQCRFPVYALGDELGDEEIQRLRAIVEGERFRRESEDATVYFALGVVLEELDTAPEVIGWIYTQASWEAEASPERYRRCAERAIAWYDKAAAEEPPPEASREDRDDHLVFSYLPIELSRRIGAFDQARARLEAMPPIDDTGIEWLPDALAYQRELIAARDAAPHAMGENPTPVLDAEMAPPGSGAPGGDADPAAAPPTASPPQADTPSP